MQAYHDVMVGGQVYIWDTHSENWLRISGIKPQEVYLNEIAPVEQSWGFQGQQERSPEWWCNGQTL